MMFFRMKYIKAISCRLMVAFLVFGVAAGLLPCPGREAVADSLAFTAQRTSMTVGDIMTFKVNAPNASWKSSNTKVLLVSAKGKVRAIRTGKARITASVKGHQVSVRVAVKYQYVVGIDPGHQRKSIPGQEPIGPGATATKPIMTSGTVGVSTGKPEYELNMEIAQELKSELENRGYEVVMTHKSVDEAIGNIDRAKKMNQRADIVIRIHADGAAASAHGASALFPSPTNPYVGNISAECERLSRCILDSYCIATGVRNRGLMLRDDLTGTNWSKVPVTLIEMGFMTNAFDDEYMSSVEGQEKMVAGMANGVDEYFGK